MTVGWIVIAWVSRTGKNVGILIGLGKSSRLESDIWGIGNMRRSGHHEQRVFNKHNDTLAKDSTVEMIA